MKGSRFTVALYLVLVFLSGLGVGLLGDSVYRTRTEHHPRSIDEFRKRYVSDMRARLRLSDGQVKQLERILDETRLQYKEARERLRPELKAIQEGQTSKIRAILDPEQIAKYEKMRAEREKRRQEKSR